MTLGYFRIAERFEIVVDRNNTVPLLSMSTRRVLGQHLNCAMPEILHTRVASDDLKVTQKKTTHIKPTDSSLAMSQESLEVGTSSGSLGMRAGGLSKIEKQWTNRQRALEEAGYMLRPRYHPRWQPSWINTNQSFWNVEDGKAQSVSSSFFRAIRRH